MDPRSRVDRRSGLPTDQSRRLIWGLIGAIFVALAVAIVVGLLREPAPPDLATPEGVTQAYLQAVFDGDISSARGYLSEDLAERCSTREFHQAWVPDSVTASLDEVRHEDGEAEVVVRLRTTEGPAPFGGGGFTMVEVFTLTQRDGEWQITTDPWPVSFCGGRR